MKLKFSPKPIKLAPDTLYGIFITDQNLEAANELLTNHYEDAFKLYAKDWEEGKVEYYYTPELKIVGIGMGKAEALTAEKIRAATQNVVNISNERELSSLALLLPGQTPEEVNATFSMAETVVLSNYQFLEYKTQPEQNTLLNAELYSEESNGPQAVESGQKVAEATLVARDLVDLTGVFTHHQIYRIGGQSALLPELLYGGKQ